jgi:3-hydroxyacyl-CoA dehydrogenase
MTIHRAAVLGSGIMGMGIAAHLANAGIPSLLLDIAAGDGKPRDALARGAIDRALKARPAPFFTPRAAALITPGVIEDDLPKLAGTDWLVEAVVERLDVKRDLFARLAGVVGPDTIVSSNTSGLPASAMVEGLPDAFRRRFLITHFFNPVRYMKLLELVPGPGCDPAVLDAMAAFGRDALGKGVVIGNDTPNFIGNRIGIYGFMAAMHRMVDESYTIDEVDAILGPALGRPRSAVFRTADLAGLDTILHVARNLYQNAPHDEQREVFIAPEYLEEMVRRGWLGEKTGQGFYKRVKEDGESRILTLDLKSMEYRPQERPRFTSLEDAKDIADPGERLRRVVQGDDRAARFAWEMLADTLTYSANRVPEIADRIEAIDDAMRWGFNWDLGPFETWDALGVRYLADRLRAEGRAVPALIERVLADGGSFYGGAGLRRTVFVPATGAHESLARPEGEYTLALLKVTYTAENAQEQIVATVDAPRVPGAILRDNRSVSLVSLGDGIACLEFHTKFNTIDADMLAALKEAVEQAPEYGYRGLVIGNDAPDFSAGANLAQLLFAARMRQWKVIEPQVKALQDANMALKYAPIPVVVAAAGRTLGGGCEIMLHGAKVRAHAELYCGQVEAGAGLVPAGGGCKELLLRYGAEKAKSGPFPAVRGAFEVIALAKVSTSAEEARELRFLRKDDPVTLDRSRLIADARADAIALAEGGYTPPSPAMLRLPGEGGQFVLEQQIEGFRLAGTISEHDAVVAGKLARVLCGADASPLVPVTEQHVLDLEREAFLALCGMPKTQARMEALLKTGKPLRN